jgi:hypothetical protein
MSPARLLGWLQSGDPIIVPERRESQRVPVLSARLGGIERRKPRKSRKQLSAMIAFRKEGRKT